ncbi:MAG: hypothetical protein V4718_12075 [Pseudomonadota bacterium]
MTLPDSLKDFVEERASLLLWLTFALLLVAISSTFKVFFPLPGGLMGHDFSLQLPAWLEGHIWFANNGLSIPWFSPSFCAGQPFFPDPQSVYYSFPQFFAIWWGPIAAAYLTLCISAGVFFWGGYVLMRKVFLTGPVAAVLTGGMLMFNGFLPHHTVVGHLTYHGFALAPWIALLLLMPARSILNQAAASVLAGVMLAYWVHSGFGTLILAGVLSVFLIGVLQCLRGGSIAQFLARSTLAGLVGLALSASKLVASFSFLAQFPRTFYQLPGAPSLGDALAVMGSALFLPSQWAYEVGLPRLTNMQFSLAPHEWAFNFGMASAVLLAALISSRVFRLARPARHSTTGTVADTGTTSSNQKRARQLVLLALLILGLVWPLAFNYYSPEWAAFVKTIPLINTASTALRWAIVYIPIIAIGTGLLLEHAGWRHWGTAAVAACLLGTLIQTSTEPREFYLEQAYDARSIMLADRMLGDGHFKGEITQLGTGGEIRVNGEKWPLEQNNTLVAGISQVFCYNPVFGYRLEKFSAENLKTGSVLAERDGFLNLKNPACYVYPKENNCKPGDLFRADQKVEATQFINFKPFAFNISKSQEWANLATEAGLGLVALFLLAWLWLAVRSRGAKT